MAFKPIIPRGETLPEAMRSQKRWIGYKSEIRNGKLTKVPYNLRTKFKTDATDASSGISFEEACRLAIQGDYAGLGFLLGDGWAGVDFDHVIDKDTGILARWAEEEIAALDSYTEVSPSGDGVHVLAFIAKKLPTNIPHNPTATEMYDRDRFFTVTGKPYSVTKGGIHYPTKPASVEERTEALHALYQRTKADWEAIKRYLAKGDKNQRLWAGNFQADFPDDTDDGGDHSSADQSLVSSLAFICNGDKAQMDRLFRHSKLYRDKWDKKHGEETYGEITLNTALESYKVKAAEAETAAPKGKSTAATLVSLGQQSTRFYRDEYGHVYAEWEGSGAHLLERSTVGQRLAKQCFETTGQAASHDAVKQAKLTIAALADEDRHKLGLRVHRPAQDRLLVDVANGQVVEITPAGWDIKPLPEKNFRRFQFQAPLPLPDPTGTPEDLLRLLSHVRASDTDRLLLACWLVTGLFPDIPHAILALHGPQGAAKSTTARLLRSLLDPGADGLLANPHDQAALAITAEKRWALAFDNLSSMPQWLSDMLCLTSTGGTVPRRQLYTDSDELLLDLRRVVIMTSIPQVGEREDLLDRMLLMRLTPIPEEERMTEGEWEEKIGPLLPKALGGLYTVAAGVLASKSRRPAKLPRLADWALIAARAAESLGYSQEDFLEAWQAVKERQVSEAADSSPVPGLVATLVKSNEGHWSGTATALYTELQNLAFEQLVNTKDKRTWPQNPKSLSSTLEGMGESLKVYGLLLNRRILDGRNLIELTMPDYRLRAVS